MVSVHYRIPAALLVVTIVICVLSIAVWQANSGLSPDSVTYLDAATNVLHGHGLAHRWAYWDPVYETYALPTKTTLWPPGYPLAIAGVAFLGIEQMFAARLISVLASTGLVLLYYYLLCAFMSPRLAVVGAAAVAMLFPLVQFYAAISTEPGFLFLSTFALLLTVHALQAENERMAHYYWLAASTVAAGAFLFRYVGLSCVVGVTVCSVWATWRTTNLRRWSYPIAATIPSGLIVVGILGRNYLESHTFGQSMPGADIFWATLASVSKTLMSEIIGWQEFSALGVFRIFPLLYGVLLAILGWQAFRSMQRLYRSAEGKAGQKPETIVSVVTLLFLALYVLLVFAGRWANGMDVEVRYLTVILPWPFLLLLGWQLREENKEIGTDLDGLGWAQSLRVPVLFLLFQGVFFGHWFLHPPPDSYVSSDKDSPTIAWLKSNVDAKEPILATRGAGVALWCANPILMLPRIPYSVVDVTSWEGVDDIANKAKARLLVHFYGYPSSRWDSRQVHFLRSLEVPENNPGRRSFVFSDGIIYQVGTAYGRGKVESMP